MKSYSKRIVALLLIVCMLLPALASCGKSPTEAIDTNDAAMTENENAVSDTDELSREELETIVGVLDESVNVEELEDAELGELADSLLEALEGSKSENIANALGSANQSEGNIGTLGSADAGEGNTGSLGSADGSVANGNYDSNGAMTQPFDKVYPELIEDGSVKYSDESLLVKMLSANGTKVCSAMSEAGVLKLEVIAPLDRYTWYKASLSADTDPQKALEAVRALDEVVIAEYDYKIQTAAMDEYKEIDESFGLDHNHHKKDQWHFHHSGIPDGYNKMKHEGGQSSVIVAVIDTGIDIDHEDLAGNIWKNTAEKPNNGIDDDGNGYIDDYYGVNIVSGKGNGDDDNGHGTHVAGIIAAQNNNLGTVGIAYKTTVMPIKAASASGYLLQSDIAKAVIYAYENGAEVINMSFGGSACSIAVQDALAAAYTRCVLVASAGNDGKPNEHPTLNCLPNYPAALTYVLGVMAVDETGTETYFTNWDCEEFNGVEYELYAPGYNIMSTLPGNRYGSLSGTSMAAPMVSAMAAILRSEFDDRDTYPTKFIYGQLASTSEHYAECIDPDAHGEHNLPQIVDLHAALTKLPKPDVSMQEFTAFDTVGLADDTASKNNGDGVIDAGETISLGLILRNRWGMSENTVVTLDAKSNAGMDEPYVTFLNPTVNYDTVGTYSTQDCGKVYTDELHTGWEDPFIIKIAEDCPNDYIIKVNVTLHYENGIDDSDTTVYTNTASFTIKVRSGIVLPSIIDEDMTLTPDNLYIIPNSTVIESGVTVRVLPGTNIQFWSNDPTDPYANGYIAYLSVRGKFLVEGTKEAPVRIYPSELKQSYNVAMGETGGKGYISLVYADVTNLGYDTISGRYFVDNSISYADHCTFRTNSGYSLSYRYLSSGLIKTDSTTSPRIANFDLVENSVFYKIGLPNNGYYTIHADARRCIFADCAIRYSTDLSYFASQNCVFLGNTYYDPSSSASNKYGYSSLSLHKLTRNTASTVTVYYREATGTTYVRTQYKIDPLIVQALGGSYLVINDSDEAAFLKSKSNASPASCGVGVKYDQNTGSFVWCDGTPVDPVYDKNNVLTAANFSTYISLEMFYGGVYFSTDVHSYYLYEFAGNVLPTDITFTNYEVSIDTGVEYQLNPINAPVQLGLDDFIYESRDESVVKVSDTGLVTPVATGTADVYVYSEDRAVCNYVTFNVVDYVALEDYTLSLESTELQVGDTMQVGVSFAPADTTRTNVTFSSSDESVLTVNSVGEISAITPGTARLTAVCEGITRSVEITVLPKNITAYIATSKNKDVSNELSFSDYPDVTFESSDESIATVADGVITAVSHGDAIISAKTADNVIMTVNVTVYRKTYTFAADCIAKNVLLSDGSIDLPEVKTSDSTDVLLHWTSSDTSVADIEDGKVVLKKTGTTALVVKDLYSEESTYVTLFVSDDIFPRIKQVYIYDHVDSSPKYYLTEDNKVYRFYEFEDEPELLWENVADFDVDEMNPEYYLVALEDNTVICKDPNRGENTITYNSSVFSLTEPNRIKFAECCNGQFYIVTEGNDIYAWGNNDSNQLGIEGGSYYYDPQLVYAYYWPGSTNTHWFNSSAVSIENIISVKNMTAILVLDSEPKLFVLGGEYAMNATPVLVGRDVVLANSAADPDSMDFDTIVYFMNETWYYITTFDLSPVTLGMDAYPSSKAIAVSTSHYYEYYNSGKELRINYTCIPFSSEVTAGCVDNNGDTYLTTADGLLYYYTKGKMQSVMTIPTVFDEQPPAVVETNLDDDGMLHGNVLTVRFDRPLLSGNSNMLGGVSSYSNLSHSLVIVGDTCYITLSTLREDYKYKAQLNLYAVASDLFDSFDLGLEFQYRKAVPTAQQPEDKVVHESVLDSSIARIPTSASFTAKINAVWEEHQYNSSFYNNAILNRISTDTSSSHWLKAIAPSTSSYQIPLGHNWWGTTNETAIGMQMVDYSDFISYSRLMYEPYLTEAPEDTFPFVTSVKIFDKHKEEVSVVGNEQITVRISFNRDMDTSIPLQVRFGSAYPYGDYELEGKYVDARTWEGKYKLTTLIEGGIQYFTIENGCSATDDLVLMRDRARFAFEIDTTEAQALIMQGEATETGIKLSWTQDDFDTLMGYNVYRSTSEDGLYTRVNTTVIPADTMEFFDNTVEPGVLYFYNFTVVQTDLSESTPSGKISIRSMDTMAPDIYHSPVYNATTGSNLIISATVTDNLSITHAHVYYRTKGAEEWRIAVMNKLNDKYSAIIISDHITVEGIEYYIEAFDGVNYTYKGSADVPYTVTVQEVVSGDALGDVNGDGAITNLDALMLLKAINDQLNLTAEEFARADLDGNGSLAAKEALRILQYVSGAVGSVDMHT